MLISIDRVAEMKLTKLLLVCIFLVCYSSGAVSEYKFITFPVPLLVENRHQGILIQLFREIEARADESFQLTVKPAKRARMEFKRGSYIGIFPGISVMFNHSIHRSETIAVKQDYVFVREGSKVPVSISELEGLKVGLTRGYPYSPSLLNNNKIQFFYSNSDELNFKMLLAGRFDAMVVEEISGLQALTPSAANRISYDKQSPLSSYDAFFAFQPIQVGESLAQLFSHIISEMKQDGTYSLIMMPFNKERTKLQSKVINTVPY